MTLILSCVTEKYVIQASDRRLTTLRGKVAKEKENKAVDWAGQVAFGYTGLASILGRPTDFWLSEALLVPMESQRTVPFRNILESVRIKATEDFKKIAAKDNRWKRLTIMGAGWLELEEKKMESGPHGVRPALCTISNCLDVKGNLLEVPVDEFSARLLVFDKLQKGFFVASIGQQIRSDKAAFLQRNIEKCLKQTDVGPEPIARLLVETIRAVAQDNPTVGSDVLVACIPKESLHSSRILMSDGSIAFLVLSSKPRKLERTFQYVPNGKEQGVEYGPNYVLGASWLRGFFAMRANNQRSVEVRTMKLEDGATQGVLLFDDGVNAQFICPPLRLKHLNQ